MGRETNRYGLIVRFDLLDAALNSRSRGGVRRADDRDGGHDSYEEPGTLAYIVHTELTSPGIRVFYELYREEAAFDAHEEGAHVRRFLSERGQHLRRDPKVWRVRPCGGVSRAETDSESG